MDRLVLAYTQVCWELPTQYTVDVYIAIAYFMLGAKNVPLADMRQYGVEGLAGKLRSVFSSWRVAREEEFVRSALIYFVSESDAVIGPSFQREVERSVAWGWDELDEWGVVGAADVLSEGGFGGPEGRVGVVGEVLPECSSGVEKYK